VYVFPHPKTADEKRLEICFDISLLVAALYVHWSFILIVFLRIGVESIRDIHRVGVNTWNKPDSSYNSVIDSEAGMGFGMVSIAIIFGSIHYLQGDLIQYLNNIHIWPDLIMKSILFILLFAILSVTLMIVWVRMVLSLKLLFQRN